MKKHFRYVVFFALLAVAFFGSGTSSKSAEIRNPPIACVSSCAFRLSLCFANGLKNNDNACISIYRSCIAQCKND